MNVLTSAKTWPSRPSIQTLWFTDAKQLLA